MTQFFYAVNTQLLVNLCDHLQGTASYACCDQIGGVHTRITFIINIIIGAMLVSICIVLAATSWSPRGIYSVEVWNYNSNKDLRDKNRRHNVVELQCNLHLEPYFPKFIFA